MELGAGNFFWHDNNLGPEAATAIAEGLEFNTTLQYLGLNRNLIGQNSTRVLVYYLKWTLNQIQGY